MRNLESFPIEQKVEKTAEQTCQEVLDGLEFSKKEGDKEVLMDLSPKEKVKIAETSLKEQERELDIQERDKNRKVLTGIKSALAIALVSGASFLGIGYEKEAVAGPTEEKTKSEQKEKENIQEASEAKSLLKETLFKIADKTISGEIGISKMEDGNLVIHAKEGKYYELTNNDIKELMGISTRFQRMINGAEKHENQKIRIKTIQAAKRIVEIEIREKIIKLGKPVVIENLPENLKKWEGERQKERENAKKTTEEMKKPLIEQ